MQGKAKRVAMVAICVTFAFALVELLAALAFVIRPTGNPLAFPYDQSGLHIFQGKEIGAPTWIKPNYRQIFRTDEFNIEIRTNNVGLREDFDYRGEKLDIAVVGGSFTFGYGVNAGERYSDRLRHSFEGAKVASLAYINGTSTPGYFLFLKQNPEFIPRVLIIELFAWSDIREGITSLEWTYDDSGQLVKVRSKMKAITADGFLVDRQTGRRFEPSWRRFMRKFNAGRLYLLILDKLAHEVPIVIAQEKQGVAKITEDPWIFETGKFDAHVFNSLNFIERMDTLVQASGGSLLVLNIPASYKVGHYPHFCETETHYDTKTCKVLRQTNGLGEALAAWFDERDISFIDPTEVFRKLESEGERLYFERNAHWKSAGHAAAASLLISHIRDAGYLD